MRAPVDGTIYRRIRAPLELARADIMTPGRWKAGCGDDSCAMRTNGRQHGEIAWQVTKTTRRPGRLANPWSFWTATITTMRSRLLHASLRAIPAKRKFTHSALRSGKIRV